MFTGEFTYNEAGRLTAETYDDLHGWNHTSLYTYYSNGLLKDKTDQNNGDLSSTFYHYTYTFYP
jgi:hypothetical protein